MKVVILAGGLGTRLAEQTEVRPKPMVEIGGRPILWHIIKHYDHYQFNDFYIALGYKGDVIKRYFIDYINLGGSMTVHMTNGRVDLHDRPREDWSVHLIDTGQNVNTGGRLKALQPHLGNETFMLTYGDGVGDVDLDALLAFHRAHGKLATVTAVRPPARFGGISFEGDMVKVFAEKPQIGEGWINGGFMVFEPGIFEYLEGPTASLEAHMLERLAQRGQLAAYRHDRFWQCMDTMRDLRVLEDLWERDKAPWKLWHD
ncbi:MAG: glucose-1-phosphate cytidylyltransferase [Planctomycetes bacterium]|nr:glucose-1-phosphate cytidylyltransferase [Planctomycetota bacterium]